MGISTMVRFTGRVAVFAAIAALLLQASCTISLPRLGIAETIPMDDSGCHHSLPATPDAPNPSHICCNGVHSPEALLTASITPAQLPFAEAPLNRVSYSTFRSRQPIEIANPSSGPPVPLALRI